MTNPLSNNKPSSRGRIVVGGLAFYYPLAGVAWQILHYLLGLQRLGWDVCYVEDGYWHSQLVEADDSSLAVAGQIQWVAGLLERYGFAGRWHYHAVWDGRSYGADRATAMQWVREADAFVNVCGSQMLTDDHLACPRRIFLETDPVAVQIQLAQNNPVARKALEQHTVLFTFGENLGTETCPLATGGYTWHATRQPVLMDEWATTRPPPAQAPYTTVGNWEAAGKDVELEGRIYHWQKGMEFLKFRDLPARVTANFLLGMNFDNDADRMMMENHGWQTTPAIGVSLDVDTYRTFIQQSRGEFTVAKEQNIVFHTGWFSDRAVTYLAAGRPVINQDTGFARNLPVGAGLFSFATLDDGIAAVNAIEADYAKHSRAAVEIAREYLATDRVLPLLLQQAGL